MSIEAGDIKLKLATNDGPGNSAAGSPNSSLGGFLSTTEIVDNVLHNLFAPLTGAENAAEGVKYRCVFVHNTNAVDTFLSVVVYLVDEVAGGANAALGVDTVAASAQNSASEQSLVVADEDTAPVGVIFSAPTTLETALALGDIGPNSTKAFWVRRTATDSAAQANDGATLRVQGETL